MIKKLIKSPQLSTIAIIVFFVALFLSYIFYDKKNAENFFVIFEAIISSAVFIGFLYEMHQQTKNQKTAELRNETLAFLNNLQNHDIDRTSSEVLRRFMIFFKRAVKHNNNSLINEFVLHEVTERMLRLNQWGSKSEYEIIKFSYEGDYLSEKIKKAEDNGMILCQKYFDKNFPKELAEIEQIREELFGAARGT